MKLRLYRIQKYDRILLTLILIPSLVLLSSCAVIYNGSEQLIPVGSSPQGAEVFVDGELTGTTPLELELARASSHTILLRLGELEREVIITNTLNGGMVALDVVPGAIMVTLTILGATACGHSTFCDFQPAMPYFLGATLLIGGAPIVVDAATGAWYELSPGEVFVDFEQSVETE
jgi:PEGA domain